MDDAEQATLDIEFRFVFPRSLLDPAHTQDEIVEQVTQILYNEWKSEIVDGVQIHLANVSEGLLIQ